VNNFLRIILIFFFITNCSLQKNSKFWTKHKIVEETNKNYEEIFKKEEALNLEFNKDLKVNFNSKPINRSFLNNLSNNNGRVNFNGKLQNISKYKFSKIKNFYQYDPKISFYKNDIIFFDNKGSVLRFNDSSDLIWKVNNYTKTEKKQNPILSFGVDQNFLIIADNLSKYYALDINTGKILWSKNNTSPFNSQIKIYKDKFFIVDFENTLRAYSVFDGKEIWNIKTQSSLIRSQKKLSIVIIDKKIYFNNSLGDISAVDIKSGDLIWQMPTQNSLAYNEFFLLQTSDIIGDKNSLYFSNNKNQFYSLDVVTGTINWQQKINSSLRPTVIDNYIFTISIEGYLIIIDKVSGNIIRITDVFKEFTTKKRNKINPTGFIVGKDYIYLTTTHGRLIVIKIVDGTIKNMIKIANSKITRPSTLNNNLFIINSNAIIKLN
tara:strand:+ start:117 stop:1418 length:1302 start_codon:yes stop_codon:yes gene_type:complete